MVSGEFIIDEPVIYEGVPGALDKLERDPTLTRWPELEARIPENTRVLANYLSDRLGVDSSELYDALAERTRHIAVFQTARLPEGDNVRGAFDGRAMAIKIATAGLSDEEVDDNFLHETTHPAMIGGVQKVTYLPSDSEFAKSGLMTFETNAREPKNSKNRVMSNGIWITEALNDDTKDQAFNPTVHQQSYFTERVILRSLDECMPGIYDVLLDAAFLGNYSKAEAWGMIEAKFGPLWIEYVEEELKLLKYNPDTVDHNPITAIMNSVPEEYRAKFKEAMLRNRAELDGLA